MKKRLTTRRSGDWLRSTPGWLRDKHGERRSDDEYAEKLESYPPTVKDESHILFRRRSR